MARQRHCSQRLHPVSFVMSTNITWLVSLMAIMLLSSSNSSSNNNNKGTILLFANAKEQEEQAETHSILGDSSCPCLQDPDLLPPIDPREYNVEGRLSLISTVGPVANTSEYGIGCHHHDIETPQCIVADPSCEARERTIPAPIVACDTSWCHRHWCFVDPTNCTLSIRRHPSFLFSDRYYSYATCGDMDAFTNNRRFASLEGQQYKIGLNANSGGWLGAYHADGLTHFEGPISKWSGLAVDFMTKAAVQGRFSLEMATPPEFLRNRSTDFFGSDSEFDLCVYATSLGYLDFCVAQYTITNQRASSTDWLLLGSQGIYLVVDTEDANIGTIEFFMRSISTIFKPFTMDTWIFVVFFVIPVLGCLMVVHERGRGGSTYPVEEAVVVTDEKTGESVLKKRPVPLHKNLIKSIYIAYLAVLQQSYEQSVLTLGAMLNLLGMSFFILTIIAVYTANLAAILTQNQQQTSIDSFDAAIQAGYRICSERKNMETIQNMYPNLNSNLFVRDPVYLGGDGRPGFNSAHSRTRVFDFMDPFLADKSPRYCHAAIAPLEDLEVLQAARTHCNKTAIGDPIQMIQTGIPIFESVSPQLISFFLKLKNDGHYDSSMMANKPQSQCMVQSGGEGSALNLAQLSGIWVVSFSFAFAGLVATWLQSFYKKKLQSKSSSLVKRVHKRDQRGGRIDALGIEDSWMTANEGPGGGEQGSNSRPELKHEGSKAGSIHLMRLNSKGGLSPSSRGGSCSVIEEDRSFGNTWLRRDGSFPRRRKVTSPSIRGSSSFPSPTNRQHPEPSYTAADSCSESGVFTTDDYDNTSYVGNRDRESILENREKLRKIIDDQANTIEDNGTGNVKIINNGYGDGSFELMSALDDLAFGVSLSKDDSQV